MGDQREGVNKGIDIYTVAFFAEEKRFCYSGTNFY